LIKVIKRKGSEVIKNRENKNFMPYISERSDLGYLYKNSSVNLLRNKTQNFDDLFNLKKGIEKAAQ